jgi:hypothetical protein
MKTLIYLAAFILLSTCSKEETPKTAQNTKQNTEHTTSINSKTKPYIKLTFKDGILKGTHYFSPPKGNYLSQVNIGFHENVSTLNSSKIITANGLQIHTISRAFEGEVAQKKHMAKRYTEGCGNLNFIDLENKQPFKRIDGVFTGCSTTEIVNISPWKKGVVKYRRKIFGKFTDTVQLVITKKDASKETITTVVEGEFLANQSKF